MPPSKPTLPAASSRATPAGKSISRQKIRLVQYTTVALRRHPNPNAQGSPGFLTHSYTVPNLIAKTRLMVATAMPSPYISVACSLICSEWQWRLPSGVKR